MSSENSFYKDLKAFREFSQLAEHGQFVRAPDSWCILITDIKGSTKAIQNGRYKDVNLIGAASITCICNIAGVDEIPFVFGGDGATILIPDHLLTAATQELRALQKISQRDFNLELRVGYVRVARLRELGSEIWIGKYELSPGNYTAQFKGGALMLAEDMIKKARPHAATMIEPTEQDLHPQLAGLSCRLEPIQNRNGIVLSILVKPLKNSDQSLKKLLAELKDILNGDFLSVRPVSLNQLKWRWPPESLHSEILTQKQKKSYFIQMISSALRALISGTSLSLNIPLGPFKPSIYKSQLISNSDFKKFDETLRMVIDCSVEQSKQIEKLLEILHTDGEIKYGVHKSEKALMTCMVKSATGNRHIHFIDGADGGYALAAVQLKAQ